MARRRKPTSLSAPFLRRLALREDVQGLGEAYPLNLPWLTRGEFALEFTTPVTVFVGENGCGKSTLIEAVAALSGYDEAGGGKGYGAVDHSGALDRSGADLGGALRASWLPKVTDGWFFRAETFFSVARYLDAVGSPTADFLSWSHGEGFLRLFEERMARKGIYFLDEPESALSPKRQMELLRILARIQETASAQILMATHSPLLMAIPGARVLEITRLGFYEVDYRDTEHFRLYQDFTVDPDDFVARALRDDEA